MQRRLRMGMVGGGPGAFIGNVHRLAAQLDDHVELVAGCFSSDAERSRAGGAAWRVDPGRTYTDFEAMARAEAALPEGERIDFVTIATPNHLHLPVAEAFLKAGIHVVSDKPATVSLDEARRLAQAVEASGCVYALTHNYSGYPMVREARALVASGKLGRLLKVVAEYPQGWLLRRIEEEGQKQASWRTDPKRAGLSGAVGDIGSHAEHLGRFITGLEIERLCADFTTFVSGRALEDDAQVLIHYRNPCGDASMPPPRGLVTCSQICAGEENGPHIRVYGTQGSLEWHQPEPNQLWFKPAAGPVELRKPGHGYNTVANAYTRLPAGHPEAFLEAFANLYLDALSQIAAAQGLEPLVPPIEGHALQAPGIRDALLGMAFIETTVASARSEAKWTPFPQL